MFCRYGMQGDVVRYHQFRLLHVGFSPGAVDGDYGDATAKALLAACLKQNPAYAGDGRNLGPAEAVNIDALWAKRWGAGPGPEGPQGPAGPQGPKGDPGEVGDLTAVVRAIGEKLAAS